MTDLRTDIFKYLKEKTCGRYHQAGNLRNLNMLKSKREVVNVVYKDWILFECETAAAKAYDNKKIYYISTRIKLLFSVEIIVQFPLLFLILYSASKIKLSGISDTINVTSVVFPKHISILKLYLTHRSAINY